jgi:hemoglobin/transferrin/lactoferrin receptor protein
VVDATAFYTDADDYLATVACASTQYECVNQQRDDIYINADKATSHGIELDASVDFEQVSLYTSFTVSKREQTVDDYKTDKTGLPSLYGKFGAKYFAESAYLGNYWLDAYLRAASDADYQRSESEDNEHYAGWGTFNLAFGSRFGKDDMMMLSFEAVNLTDKAYRPAAEKLMAVGRSFQAKFSVEF